MNRSDWSVADQYLHIRSCMSVLYEGDVLYEGNFPGGARQWALPNRKNMLGA